MSNIGTLISQYKNENDGWKRIIAFMKDENVHLKNLLSGVVKNLNTNDVTLLERIEYFQNNFLAEDETIRYLREDINDQAKFLMRDIYEDHLSLRTLKDQQDKLRNEFEKKEKAFNRLKFEFNNYLSNNL